MYFRTLVHLLTAQKNCRKGGSFAGAVLLVGVMQISAALAQTPGLPTGPGRVNGQVLHSESGAAVPDLEVVLYALSPDGAPGLARTRSNEEGRFEFTGISTRPAITYLLGARYHGLPYPGEHIRFGAGEREATALIRVAELTSSRAALRVVGVAFQLQRVARGLRVTQQVRFHNEGARTFYQPTAQRRDPAGGRASAAAFEAVLPAGAADFEMPLGAVPEGLLRSDRKLSYFGPIHPGAHELSFSYTLAGARDENDHERFALRLASPEGAPLEVRLPPGLGQLTAPGLRLEPAPAEAAAPGPRQERWSNSAGGVFDIELLLPPGRRDPAAVRPLRARVLLRVDDTALEVNESYTLQVSGDAVLLADFAAPFFHLTLPARATALEFGSDAPGVTLEAHPDGGLIATGSAAPGLFQIGARYQLAVEQAPARFTRRFATRLPLLAIFLTDSGDLLPASKRLHRRRPLREAERNYQHLEAFEITPDEVVELVIGRRAPPAAARGPLSLAAAALLALGAVVFLSSPLRSRAAGIAAEPVRSATAREAEALARAEGDLDHDLETGKLSVQDHAALLSELRAQARALQEREQQEVRRAETAARTIERSEDARSCARCDARLEAAHRFCPNCGAKRAQEASPG